VETHRPQIPPLLPAHRVSIESTMAYYQLTMNSEAHWVPGERLNCHGAHIEFNQKKISGVLNVLLFSFVNILRRLTLTEAPMSTRWPRGQCVRCAIVEAKQLSQRSVIGWVTKIYYLKLLRPSEGTLLVPAPFAVVSTYSSFKEGWRQAGGRS
jgi:hypothetical protein